MLVLVNHAMLKFFSPRLMASQEFAINLVLLLSSQAPTLRPTLTLSITLPSDSLYGCDRTSPAHHSSPVRYQPCSADRYSFVALCWCTVVIGGCVAPPKNLAFDDAKASKDLVVLLLSTNPKNKRL